MVRLSRQQSADLSHLKGMVRKKLRSKSIGGGDREFQRRFGNQGLLASRLQEFFDLSGSHYSYMEERLRSLAEALGNRYVRISFLESEKMSPKRTGSFRFV